MTSRSLSDEIRDELPSLDLDAETRAALERWLAADKEFNLWFLVTTKRSLADDDLMSLLEGYRVTQETAEDAWRALRAGRIDPAGLRAGLAESVTKMHLLMRK